MTKAGALYYDTESWINKAVYSVITCRDKQHALTDQLTRATGVLVFVSVCEHLINPFCAGINYISGCGKGLAWIIIIVCCVNVCYQCVWACDPKNNPK